jgi:hypothetical protein
MPSRPASVGPPSVNSIASPKTDRVPARLRQLAGRPFVRNVVALTTGTAAAQIVTVIFGALGAFTAVLGVLAPGPFADLPVRLAFAGFHNDVAAVAAFCLAGALLNAFLVTATLVACSKARPQVHHGAVSLSPTGAQGRPDVQQVIS